MANGGNVRPHSAAFAAILVFRVRVREHAHSLSACTFSLSLLFMFTAHSSSISACYRYFIFVCNELKENRCPIDRAVSPSERIQRPHNIYRD